jgi:RNA polymerase sigma-70 factor (ECF subfamily)
VSRERRLPPDDPRPAETSAIQVASAKDFMSLFLEDQRRVHAYIVALVARHQDADDLLQETAAVLWRRFDEFESGTNFFAWACKTAYLVVLGYRRRKGREVVTLDDDVLEKLAVFSSHSNSLLAVRVSALEQCLDKLPTKDRALLERCYSPNKRARDVAVELGRPEASVYKSLGRIRRTLADCIRRTLSLAEREEGIG